MAMLKITAGEFRDNPQRYLDQVDAGEELMLQRSGGKQYLVILADDVLADIPPRIYPGTGRGLGKGHLLR